jgi:hypothetical protein
VEYIEKTAKRLDLEGLPLKNMPTTVQLDTPKEDDARPLNPEEHYRYQSLVGSLRYLTTILRVDLGNPVRRLSHYLQSPLLHHQKLAFHGFGYVLNTKHYGLAFKVTSDDDKKPTGYSDASFSLADEGHRSLSGGLINFDGSAIIWFSKRQNIISKCTMDDQLIALEVVRAKVDRVRSLLQELEYPVSRAPPIFEDHRGLRDAAHGVEAYGGSSSLNKKLLNIRTAINNSVLIKEIDTKAQLADFLTKSFPRNKLQEVV